MISTRRAETRSARSSWSGTTTVRMCSRSRRPSMGARGARPTRGVGEAFGGVTWRSFRRGPTSLPGTIRPAAARGKTAPYLSLTVCAVCRICSARPNVPTDAHRDRRLVRPPGRVGVRVGAAVTQPETFVEGRREILRQASVALGGRPVTGWEGSARAEHELSNPLTAARAGLQLAMESLGRWTEVAAGRRLELLDELGQVVEDIDRSASFLRAVKDRARGALARSERFDAVRVVRSCCTLESRVLKEKKIPLEFDSTLEVVNLKGDPNALSDRLGNLIRTPANARSRRPPPPA